jgi:hypothetical protein
MKLLTRSKRVGRPIVSALLSCIAISSIAAEHAPTDGLRKLPDNSWTLVDLGGVTAPLGIMAYSGGWYDPDNHQFCLFGGGHFNYSGNEVWCFDIASLTWHEVYPPDAVVLPPYSGADQGPYDNYDNEKYPGALFNPASERIDTAAPVSRHTYDQLEYLAGYGAVLWGGYAWGDPDSPWCTLCRDTWNFTFSDRNWQYLYDGRNPSPNISPGVGASAYSVRDGLLYAKVLRATWAYDPKKNRWSEIRTSGSPPWTIEGTLEYDPVHNKLYFFGGNYEPNHVLWTFDSDKRKWTEVMPEGPAPSGAASSGPGIAYDTQNDVLAVYFGGTIWIYDPSVNTWQEHRPEMRPSDNDYVFGRFRYDPVNNGFWLHVPEQGQHATWFYRYHN